MTLRSLLYRISLPLAALAFLGAGLAARAGAHRPILAADLAILHARVYTGEPRQPEARAVAVVGNRIAAVGSEAEIRETVGPRTRVIDAGGRLVLPGFNDAHVHFMDGGFQL